MKLKSLMLQISFAIIISLTTSLLLFAFYQFHTSRLTYQHELKQELNLISQRLVNSLRIPLYNFDNEAIKDVILSEMQNTNVIAVSLTEWEETRPSLIYTHYQHQTIQEQTKLPKLDNTISQEQVVSYQRENLGKILVYLTTTEMRSKLDKLLLTNIIQIIILDILLIFICILLLKFKFVNPIIKLTEVATHITQGDLNQPIHINVENEIGILAESFKKMRNAIKDKISSLALLNEELTAEIEERKQVEVKLKNSRENLRITLNSIGDAVIATDDQGKVTHMNPAAEQLTGYNVEESQGKSFYHLFHIVNELTNEQIDNPIKNVIESGDIIELPNNTILIDKAKTKKHISTSAAPIRNTEGTVVGIVLAFKDITEKLRLEEQLQQAQKMDSIGQLAGGIAHDFNNMLAGITGAADLAQKNISQDDKSYKYLQIINNASEKAADLTQKLLDFSRKGKVFSVVIDIHETIENALDILERSIDKKITINKKFTATQHHTKGDPTQLQNVFINLGVNARDAMPSGGELTFSTSNISISEQDCQNTGYNIQAGNYISITIQDTGSGIQANLLAHIFEPFFTTKKIGEGTGLGLASVYGAIKEHQGTITVTSEVNQGTTFTIFLPVSESTSTSQATLENKILHGKGSILLVDDEKIVQASASAMLEELGYNVITANDGEQAIKSYREKSDSIDLVLLDLVMPKMSGSDTFYALKQINPAIKVIFSSGFTQNKEVDELIKAGGIAFIHKPYHFSELSQKLVSALK